MSYPIHKNPLLTDIVSPPPRPPPVLHLVPLSSIKFDSLQDNKAILIDHIKGLLSAFPLDNTYINQFTLEQLTYCLELLPDILAASSFSADKVIDFVQLILLLQKLNLQKDEETFPEERSKIAFQVSVLQRGFKAISLISGHIPLLDKKIFNGFFSECPFQAGSLHVNVLYFFAYSNGKDLALKDFLDLLKKAPAGITKIIEDFNYQRQPEALYDPDALRWWVDNSLNEIIFYSPFRQLTNAFKSNPLNQFPFDWILQIIQLTTESRVLRNDILTLIKLISKMCFGDKIQMCIAGPTISSISIHENSDGILPFLSKLLQYHPVSALNLSTDFLFPSSIKKRKAIHKETLELKTRKKPRLESTRAQPPEAPEKPMEGSLEPSRTSLKRKAIHEESEELRTGKRARVQSTKAQPPEAPVKPMGDTLEAYRISSQLSEIRFSPRSLVAIIQERSQQKLHPEEVKQILHHAENQGLHSIAFSAAIFASDLDYTSVFSDAKAMISIILPTADTISGNPECLRSLQNLGRQFPIKNLKFPQPYSVEWLSQLNGLFDILPRECTFDLSEGPSWSQEALQQLLRSLNNKPAEFVFSFDNHPSLENFLRNEFVTVSIHKDPQFDVEALPIYDANILDNLFLLNRHLRGRKHISETMNLSVYEFGLITWRSIVTSKYFIDLAGLKHLSEPDWVSYLEVFDFLLNHLCFMDTEIDFYELAASSFSNISDQEILDITIYPNICMRTLRSAFRSLRSVESLNQWYQNCFEICEQDEYQAKIFAEFWTDLNEKEDLEKFLALHAHMDDFEPSWKDWEILLYSIDKGIINCVNVPTILLKWLPFLNLNDEDADAKESILRDLLPYFIKTKDQQASIDIFFRLIQDPFFKGNGRLCATYISYYYEDINHLEDRARQAIPIIVEWLYIIPKINKEDRSWQIHANDDFNLEFMREAAKYPELFQDYPNMFFFCLRTSCARKKDGLEVWQDSFKKLIANEAARSVMIETMRQPVSIPFFDEALLSIFREFDYRNRIFEFKDFVLTILSQSIIIFQNNQQITLYVDLLFLMLSKGECPSSLPIHSRLELTQTIAAKVQKLNPDIQMNRLKTLLPLAVAFMFGMKIDNALENMLRGLLKLSWFPNTYVISTSMIPIIFQEMAQRKFPFDLDQRSKPIAFIDWIVATNPNLTEAEQKGFIHFIKLLFKANDEFRLQFIITISSVIFFENNQIIADWLFNLTVKNPNYYDHSTPLNSLLAAFWKKENLTILDKKKIISLVSRTNNPNSTAYGSKHFFDLLSYYLTNPRSSALACFNLCKLAVYGKLEFDQDQIDLLIKGLIESINGGIRLPEVLTFLANIRDPKLQTLLQMNCILLSSPSVFCRDPNCIQLLLPVMNKIKIKLDSKKHEDFRDWTQLCEKFGSIFILYSLNHFWTPDIIYRIFTTMTSKDSFGSIYFAEIQFRMKYHPEILDFQNNKEFNSRLCKQFSEKVEHDVLEERLCLKMLSQLQLHQDPVSFYKLLASTPSFLKIMFKHIEEDVSAYVISRKPVLRLLQRLSLEPNSLKDSAPTVCMIVRELFPEIPKDLFVTIVKAFPGKEKDIIGKELTPEQLQWKQELSIPVNPAHFEKAKELINVPPIPTTGIPSFPLTKKVDLLQFFEKSRLDIVFFHANYKIKDSEEFFERLKQHANHFEDLSGFIVELSPQNAFEATAKILHALKSEDTKSIEPFIETLQILWLVILLRKNEKEESDLAFIAIKQNLQNFLGIILLQTHVTAVPEDEAECIKFWNTLSPILRLITAYFHYRDPNGIQDHLREIAKLNQICATGFEEALRMLYYIVKDENKDILPFAEDKESRYQDDNLENSIHLLLHEIRWQFFRDHRSVKHYEIDEGLHIHFWHRVQLELSNIAGIYNPISRPDPNDTYIPVATNALISHMKSEFQCQYNSVTIIDWIEEAFKSRKLTYEKATDWFQQKGFSSAHDMYDEDGLLKRESIVYILKTIGVLDNTPVETGS